MKFNIQISCGHYDVITCILLSVITATKLLLYKSSEGNNVFGQTQNGNLKLAHNEVPNDRSFNSL
jgi:hypothetical protein